MSLQDEFNDAAEKGTAVVKDWEESYKKIKKFVEEGINNRNINVKKAFAEIRSTIDAIDPTFSSVSGSRYSAPKTQEEEASQDIREEDEEKKELESLTAEFVKELEALRDEISTEKQIDQMERKSENWIVKKDINDIGKRLDDISKQIDKGLQDVEAIAEESNKIQDDQKNAAKKKADGKDAEKVESEVKDDEKQLSQFQSYLNNQINRIIKDIQKIINEEVDIFNLEKLEERTNRFKVRHQRHEQHIEEHLRKNVIRFRKLRADLIKKINDLKLSKEHKEEHIRQLSELSPRLEKLNEGIMACQTIINRQIQLTAVFSEEYSNVENLLRNLKDKIGEIASVLEDIKNSGDPGKLTHGFQTAKNKIGPAEKETEPIVMVIEKYKQYELDQEKANKELNQEFHEVFTSMKELVDKTKEDIESIKTDIKKDET